MCKETSLNSVQITLDGDRELHNRTRNEHGKPSYDKILNNIINFCQYSPENTVILRINYTAEVINAGLKDVFAAIPVEIRPQIKVLFQRVWQTVGVEQSPEALREHTDYVQKIGFPLASSTAYNLFQGRLCYADAMNYANINFDGNVFRCTAYEYCSGNRMGYLNDE